MTSCPRQQQRASHLVTAHHFSASYLLSLPEQHQPIPLSRVAKSLTYPLRSRALPSPSPMRGLNLSRLARASEGTYFKSEQATQASQLRKTLTSEQLKALRQRHQPEPSVDTLPEISAHSAYKRLDPPPTPLPTKPNILSRVNLSSASHHPRPNDPPILRALGSSRFNLYHQHQQQHVPQPVARPLPGGEKYADGAVLGLTSFSVATALVSSVGLSLGAVVYLNPGLVDIARDRTRRFARRMDATLGQSMRRRVERLREDGPVVGEENRVWIGGLLRSAVGGKEITDQEKQMGEKQKDSER